MITNQKYYEHTTILVFGSHQLNKSNFEKINQFASIVVKGEGLQGKCYGIPTTENNGNMLNISKIEKHIEKFKEYAKTQNQLTFFMTGIGCGFENYSICDIAPLFKDSPKNILFPSSFRPYMEYIEPFEVDDIKNDFELYKHHIEINLRSGKVASMLLNYDGSITGLENIWKISSDENTNVYYSKLKDSQFKELSDLIKKRRIDDQYFEQFLKS